MTRLAMAVCLAATVVGCGPQAADSFDAVDKALGELPGQAGFSLQVLGDAPRTLASRRADEPAAVGSSFKLVVLAALADEIARGKRTWADTVKLRNDWVSLPSGLLQDWPDGSPVTLHTLATLMISKSDNTAADHLIHTLGRERVEAVQEQLQVGEPGRNRPFLTTGEMFRLKLILGPDVQRRYVQAPASERRRLLTAEVAGASLAGAQPATTPRLIREVEWFFSPNDLCRTLDWLRRSPVPMVRELLAINPGLTLEGEDWSYVGFKGGAEAGVLSLNFLLRDRQGRWLALAMAWNNPQADVDHDRLTALALRLINLARQRAR
jgi:hypothetical protein